MRLSKHLLLFLSAVTFMLPICLCHAQAGDSLSVRYKIRYSQLYQSYTKQPHHIPTLISLSDFYADSLNPMFNRPLSLYYIDQADLYFAKQLQDKKQIRETNRLIKQGIGISMIREKRNAIISNTMAYLQTNPPLSQSEIAHYAKYFKCENAIKQQLNKLKVDAAYREANLNQRAEDYYTFLNDYGETDKGDSAQAELIKQTNQMLLHADSEAEVDAIAQRFANNNAVQYAAEKRKGHIAYLKAYNSHNAEAYHNFLLRYPSSDDYMNALDMLDTIAIEQFYLLHTAQEYVDFIRLNDADPLAEKAMQHLRNRIEEHHDVGAAKLYLKHYPLDPQHARLYQLYYTWHANEGNGAPIDNFANQHTDYPFAENIQLDLAQGVRIDAFDLMRPYKNSYESEYASFIRMNMGKRIIFVALQRMLQNHLDRKQWKVALAAMEEFSICFESECKNEYLALKNILDTDNGIVCLPAGEPTSLTDNNSHTPHPSLFNSPYIVTDAYMFPDGSGMLFASDRPDGCNIQHSGDNYHGDTALATDLYYVSYTNGQWGTPIHLDNTVNTPYCERYPLMSKDRKTLYFVSDGHGGMGYGDIYRTTRLDGSWQHWSTPENLGRNVNSAHRESNLVFNDDESLLFFLSDRNNKQEWFSIITEHSGIPIATDDNWSLDDVTFHSDNNNEYITYEGNLPALVNYMAAHPEINIDIVSHHQGVHSEQCYRISLQRGKAIKRYLTSHGIEYCRIRISAYGNSHKAKTNITARLTTVDD